MFCQLKAMISVFGFTVQSALACFKLAWCLLNAYYMALIALPSLPNLSIINCSLTTLYLRVLYSFFNYKDSIN